MEGVEGLKVEGVEVVRKSRNENQDRPALIRAPGELRMIHVTYSFGIESALAETETDCESETETETETERRWNGSRSVGGGSGGEGGRWRRLAIYYCRKPGLLDHVLDQGCTIM
jgi:hypothetical protein